MQLSKRKVSSTKASIRVKPAAAEEGPHKQQRHRAIANARERDRTESVNYAFTLLRSLLPTEPPNRKLSKIEVLRLATSYIEHLDNVRTAVNTGDTADNVCVRMKSQAHPGSATKGRSKVCCTFCVTASKKMTATNFSQTPTQVEIVDIGPAYSELGWSCNFDLTNECLVSVPAVPGEMTKSQPPEFQAEQTISYTELDNMSTLFSASESSTLTATPLLQTTQSGGVISFSSETFDWNSSDLVDLNQWNYSLIE